MCNTASGDKDRRRRAIDLHEEHNHVILHQLRKTLIDNMFFGFGAKLRSPIVFCDPLNNHPTIGMKTLGDLVVRHISSATHDHCIINNKRFHVLHIPTQPNGTDSGYYVMQPIRMLVEEFIQGFEYDDFVSMA